MYMPITSELGAGGKWIRKEGKVILSYLASSWPDWATRDPVSKREGRKRGREEKECREDRIFLFHLD